MSAAVKRVSPPRVSVLPLHANSIEHGRPPVEGLLEKASSMTRSFLRVFLKCVRRDQERERTDEDRPQGADYRASRAIPTSLRECREVGSISTLNSSVIGAIRLVPQPVRSSLETEAMESNGLTYTFRTPDGWTFGLPSGSSVLVGREGGGADILFSHPAFSRRHSRWVNASDTCTIECLVNRWWVRVNGRAAPTTGITLKSGDLIELVPGLTMIVDVETAGDSASSRGTT